MSKYHIIVNEIDYQPEGNQYREKQVYCQETSDNDVVKKIALAVNSDKSEAIAPVAHSYQDIDQLLERVLKLVTGRHLTEEQANLVRTIYAYREIK